MAEPRHTGVLAAWLPPQASVIPASCLKPHRIESFKISTDPNFSGKLEAIVGLYLAPPEQAIVLCVDEKSQAQALDRLQPRLRRNRAGRAQCPTATNGMVKPLCLPH
jgi:hypothetical protein